MCARHIMIEGKQAFYDGDERISGITAWITALIGLDAALHAGEYAGWAICSQNLVE